MKTKPIDWKNSNRYLQFLTTFQTPHDVKKVMRWSWTMYDLHIKSNLIIQQWIQEGILVPATPEEALGKIFQVAQLKKILKENNLPLSGSKSELIDKLLDSIPQKMEQIISENQILKCSDAATIIITKHKDNIQNEMEAAEQKSFYYLNNGNYREACKAFTEYQRQISGSKYEMYTYLVEEIKFALSATPTILSALKSEDLKVLRVIASMQILWGIDSTSKWIPDGFKTSYENIQIPVNYILVNSKIKNTIAQHKKYSKRIEINFDSGDIDSCNLCLALDEKKFNIEEVPELPIPGCTSFTGCKCTISSVDDDVFLEYDDDLGDEEFTSDFASDHTNGKSPVELLRYLKQMLDENLITQAEYDQKKNELLSRM